MFFNIGVGNIHGGGFTKKESNTGAFLQILQNF